MSWSLSVKVPADATTQAIAEILAAGVPVGNDDVRGERDHQIRAACELVPILLDLGACGDPEQVGFNVTLSGHANPEHKPRAGWSNDCLLISISQASP